MSHTDSFIEEVTEEVRRDRLYALWQKYGPYLIGAIVAVVVAVGGKTYLDNQRRAAAEAAGGALLTASEGPIADQAAKLDELARTAGHEGERRLAALRAAAAWAAAGDPGAAAAAYEKFADDADADPMLRDFAAYRALSLRAEKMSPEAQAEAWGALANGDGAYRLLAIEARGIALYRAGDSDGAATELRAAYTDPAATQGVRQRIEQFALATGISLDN